jgi:hypothetical protein
MCGVLFSFFLNGNLFCVYIRANLSHIVVFDVVDMWYIAVLGI